jgi:hypothetical protein
MENGLLSVILVIGIWNLFVICFLGFVIFSLVFAVLPRSAVMHPCNYAFSLFFGLEISQL